MQINETIVAACDLAGITRYELAKRLGVTPQTVRDYEHTESLGSAVILRIEAATGCAIVPRDGEWLVCRREDLVVPD